MRVLYFIPFVGGTGADRWIYEGWKFAFTDLGHTFEVLTARDNWEARVAEVSPDLLFVPNLIDIGRLREALIRIRARGVRVLLLVHWPMPQRDLDIIAREEIADIYFGEREPESMTAFEARTGRRYHLIPNAANRAWHAPTDPSDKYRYDITYLGAFLPKKRRMFDEILCPLMQRYRSGVFGPRWTLRDRTLGIAQRICRKAGMDAAAQYLNGLRITVPPEEESVLYASARICVNFHEREDDGSQPHYIVNQRAFKIPACGGFQICDDVPALRKYFTEGEVVMATTPRDWFDKVAYYLAHEAERRTIKDRGTRRALKEHTYHNRVDTVRQLAGL